MPRVNPQRSLVNETNLARRIKLEREHVRHWTYDGLAKRMTDAGFAIQGSAIFKIENGGRRITVDELVGFGRVFGIDPGDLLTPIELVENRQAQALAAELDNAHEALIAAFLDLVGAFEKMNKFLTSVEPRTAKYFNTLPRLAETSVLERLAASLAGDNEKARATAVRNVKAALGAAGLLSMSRSFPKSTVG